MADDGTLRWTTDGHGLVSEKPASWWFEHLICDTSIAGAVMHRIQRARTLRAGVVCHNRMEPFCGAVKVTETLIEPSTPVPCSSFVTGRNSQRTRARWMDSLGLCYPVVR